MDTIADEPRKNPEFALTAFAPLRRARPALRLTLVGLSPRRQAALREIVLEELKPGAAVAERADLEADLRKRLMLIYHPVGTARMSDSEPDAVVDSQLRVHGLEALRVVDASIMPLIPRGNTNAPTMMIAERGADLIRGRVGAPASEPAAA